MRNSLLALMVILFLAIPGMSQEPGKRSLSLEQAIEEALRNNLDLQIEMANPEIYQALYNRSAATFIPTLTMDFSKLNRTSLSTTTFLSGGNIITTDTQNLNMTLSQKIALGGTLQVRWTNYKTVDSNIWNDWNPTYSSNINFSLSQPLLKNFGTFVTKKNIYAAQNNEKKALLTLEQRIIDLIYQVEEAYWNLVYANQNLEIQKKSLKLAQDQLRQNEIQVKVGVSAQMDILTAKAEVASRESQLLQAQNLIQTYEENLRRILNISKAGEMILPVDVPAYDAAATIDFQGMLAEALEKRPDIQQVRLDLKNRNFDVKYARNQLLPDLNLTATYYTTGRSGIYHIFEGELFNRKEVGRVTYDYWEAVRDVISRLFPTYQISLSFILPLKNDSARADYAQARLGLKQGLLQLQKTENTIFSDVKQVTMDIDAKAKIVEASRVSRELQEEKLKAEQKRNEVGLSTNYQILQFQRDLAQQQIAELQSIINYKLSMAKLNQAVGNTLEKHNLQLAEFDKTKK